MCRYIDILGHLHTRTPCCQGPSPLGLDKECMAEAGGGAREARAGSGPGRVFP